ncbi:MAG: hypothetical protein CW338_01735 [Clostridiales bacterium]|nr:hypothetical protein [Clostridiales bacterium]
MWQRFKMWLINFMDGRNGTDEFGRFLLIPWLILWVLQMFFPLRILFILSIALIIYMIFRSFSRNLEKRQAENAKYLQIRKKVLQFLKRQKNRLRDIKTHRYRKCPQCRAILRLPLKKGEVQVDCPRCREHFTVNIRL